MKKEEWNEADWMITALTKRFGKIRLRAQGARKNGAKLQGHLEPGSISDISFVIGRNGYRLTAARLHNFFPGIGASFSKLRALAAILLLLDENLLEEAERADEIFRMTGEVLAALESSERRPSVNRLIIWFHLRFFAFLGFLPSPLSLEGRRIPHLLRLAASPLFALDRVSGEEALMEQELIWLSGKLSESVKTVPAVIFADFTV